MSEKLDLYLSEWKPAAEKINKKMEEYLKKKSKETRVFRGRDMEDPEWTALVKELGATQRRLKKKYEIGEYDTDKDK